MMENSDASIPDGRHGIRRFGGARGARARRAPRGRARPKQRRGGAHPVLGDLLQAASWRDAAAAADGSVQAAIEYGPRAKEVDAAAVDVMTKLPPKDRRFLIYTSGIWVLGPAPAPVDETAPLNPLE